MAYGESTASIKVTAKECPFCSEMIPAEAAKCHRCSRSMEPGEAGVYLAQQGQFVPVEREAVSWRSGRFLQALLTGEIQQRRSGLQLDVPPKIVIRCPGGGSAAEYELVRLAVKLDRRELRAFAGGNPQPGTGTHADSVPFSFERIGPCTYRVWAGPLMRGEYALLPPGAAGGGAVPSGQAYTFGVRNQSRINGVRLVEALALAGILLGGMSGRVGRISASHHPQAVVASENQQFGGSPRPSPARPPSQSPRQSPQGAATEKPVSGSASTPQSSKPNEPLWGRPGPNLGVAGGLLTAAESREAEESRQLLQHLKDQVGQADRNLAEQVGEANGKPGIEWRKGLARELEMRLSEQHYVASAQTIGPQAQILRIQWTGIKRPFVQNFVKEGATLRAMKRIGFKQLILSDGLSFSWAYDLAKSGTGL